MNMSLSYRVESADWEGCDQLPAALVVLTSMDGRGGIRNNARLRQAPNQRPPPPLQTQPSLPKPTIRQEFKKIKIKKKIKTTENARRYDKPAMVHTHIARLALLTRTPTQARNRRRTRRTRIPQKQKMKETAIQKMDTLEKFRKNNLMMLPPRP